jgi:hypothetical protein
MQSEFAVGLLTFGNRACEFSQTMFPKNDWVVAIIFEMNTSRYDYVTFSVFAWSVDDSSRRHQSYVYDWLSMTKE